MDKILVMDQESQSFLPGTEKRASTSEFLNTQPHKKNWMSWHTIITKISLHLFIVILYTIISVATVRMNLHRCSNKTSDVPHAIDNFDVTYDSKTYDLRAPSNFFGHPTDPSTDEAWTKLLAPANIRITPAELARNNRKSVALPEGGHLAWIGVFHEIHCLNLLRQWKYKSHYYPNISTEKEDLLQFHTDHCLDRIRATLMCNPDISSLVTFDWRKVQKPVVNETKTLHACVDWERMIDSLKSRSVSQVEMQRLVNPLW